MSRVHPLAALIPFALAAALVAGCKPKTDSGYHADVAALAGVEAEEKKFFEALARVDVPTMLSVFSEEAILLPPNAPMARGKAEIRDYWTRYTGDAVAIEVLHERISYERQGDLFYEVSTYDQTVRGRDGQVTKERGKWLTVKKRQADGSWKTHVGAWSSDGDAPPPPPP